MIETTGIPKDGSGTTWSRRIENSNAGGHKVEHDREKKFRGGSEGILHGIIFRPTVCGRDLVLDQSRMFPLRS